MIKPRLSICIPTYNRARFLGATLRSIVDQAGEDVEIVISDNASADETIDIVETCRKLHPALVYFRHPENVGADRNYLKAVELASGEYCWLFGSDDEMKPGAITRVLHELGSQCDVYLCNLTLCTLEMKPFQDHEILDVNGDATFDLGDPKERQRYFEMAVTSTAFFSFIGSLIVRKEKWDRSELKAEFLGSLWIHVAKILAMIPHGLTVRYISQSLLNKRGDNDSFMDHGLVNRYGVAIEGFNRIGSTFFGAKSPEAYHLRRVVRYELPLNHLMNAKLMCCEARDIKALDELNRLVDMHYADHQLINIASHSIYRWTPLSLYGAMKKIKKYLRRLA